VQPVALALGTRLLGHCWQVPKVPSLKVPDGQFEEQLGRPSNPAGQSAQQPQQHTLHDERHLIRWAPLMM